MQHVYPVETQNETRLSILTGGAHLGTSAQLQCVPLQVAERVEHYCHKLGVCGGIWVAKNWIPPLLGQLSSGSKGGRG